jgi:4-hydroxybenzoyl-CoA reductase subunit beta
MNDFDFHAPASLSEVFEILARQTEPRVIAGGTDLMVLLKDLLVKPQTVVSLDRIEGMAAIDFTETGLDLGPMVPLWRLERNEKVRSAYPALVEAISRLAAPPIRNKATLGGNVCLDTKCIYYNQSQVWRRSLKPCFKAGGDMCHVMPKGNRCVGSLAAETAGPLWAYNAELTVRSDQGPRTTPFHAFFTGDGKHPHTLSPREIVTGIYVPRPGPHIGVAYGRFAYRKALEFSQFNITASVGLDSRGTIESVRVIFGAIGPAPVEIADSLTWLHNENPSPRLWAEAARNIPKEAARMSRCSRLGWYLQEVAVEYSERLLEQACNDAQTRIL